MCESVTFRSSSYDEDNLFTFRNGTFNAKTPWPSFVFGRGLRTPEEGGLRKGAIWEVRVPYYSSATNERSGGNTKDKSFGIGLYGSVRFMLPLGGRRWQLFAGTGLNGNTNYQCLSDSYNNTYYGYSSSSQVSTRSYYAELVPQIGLLYRPHPRILVDITLARLFGAQIAGYSWRMSTQVQNIKYDDPDNNPYNRPEHSETKLKNASFNRFYAEKLHLIDDLQFGISYLF